MKTGDYARTKSGIIGRLIIEEDTIAVARWQGGYELQDTTTYIVNDEKVYKNEIIKSSPNIIDLIEVGDILSFEDGSICRIMEIDNDLNPPYYLLKDYGGDTYWERQEYLSDLKSIVTKQQFESMEYKL